LLPNGAFSVFVGTFVEKTNEQKINFKLMEEIEKHPVLYNFMLSQEAGEIIFAKSK
jgi:hypothetical protein